MPMLSAILAMAFFVLWTYQRQRKYILILCLSYLAVGGGFLLHYVTLPIGLLGTKFLANSLFAVAVLGLSTAMIARQGRQVPWPVLGGLVLVGMAALSWFMFVDPSLIKRLFAVNFTFAAVAFVVAAELRASVRNQLADRALMVVAILGGFNFLIRPIITVWLDGSYDESYSDFYTSASWVFLNFSAVLFSVLITLCLVTGIAMDVFEELQTESHTDPLSGLLNRRGFEGEALLCLDQSVRKGLPVALVLADLDHFKAINDTYGHSVGDRVISAFGAHLRAAGGKGAVVARIGGEEFAVVLPAVDLATARLFAEGVRASFSRDGILGLSANPGRVTASFGVAALGMGEDLAGLICRADDALYKAKKGGRDSVCLAHQHVNGRSASALRP
ncbi:GGDEF domain-containing protein [Pseudaminobacter arsenicus]|uniref:diguanylate cyclase n=1 Tax=Borborobacter arsenicus TaxID=1851146 RepID=A0A432V8B8_9HYPH|nr:GGDEF domain-containing protein [Pseudaminobacter arsenicus]RUM98431.1 GGDEF domain-containing protein [Pseudaminobacter arsenicus]